MHSFIEHIIYRINQ